MIAEPERPRALHPVGAAIILAAMAGATAWGLLQFRPPAPRDEGRQGFNTTRAFEHLRVIARAPHPTGSAENRRVARYLAASLARYGLETDVQTSRIVQWFRTDDSVPPSREVRITNILGRLRGSNRDAVLLAAHYDSVPAGPGAGDNGAAVASLLETARILVADPTPRNDLIILLEDAEELGFLGAEQFVSEHPWARNVRFVVNFDARGSGGALLLGESTTPTAALADILRSARPPPYAISTSGGRLLSVLTRRSALPTDFHVFVRDGAAGLNFVFVGGADDYHTPNDSVSNLDRGTLFHVGSTALDLARAAATRDLRAPSGGQAVFLTIGPFFVTYPSPIAWVVVAAAAALLVAAAWLGLRSGRVQAAGVTAGFGAGIITLLLSGALAAGLVRVVEQVHGVDFPPIFPPVGGFGSQGWYMLGMGAASIAIAAILLAFVTSRFGLDGVLIGVIAWGLVMSLGITIFAPGLSSTFAFPALIAAAGTLVWWAALGGRLRSWGSVAVLALWAALPLVIIVPPLTFSYRAALLAGAALIAPPFAALTGLLWPQLHAMSNRRWIVPVAALVAAFAFFAVAAVTA